MGYSAEESFLFGGSASASFSAVGDTVTGKVTEPPKLVQQKDFDTSEPKTWPDGSPMNQLVVTIETSERDASDPDDDGTRRLFIKGNLKSAVAKAVKAAGARGIEVGGVLTVTYSGDGIPSRKGFKPPKEYTAKYTSPANASLSSPEPAVAEGGKLDGVNLTPETLAALAAMGIKQ